MLAITRSKRAWTVALIIGIFAYSMSNLFNYFEKSMKLPLTTHTGIFKVEKIGRMPDYFFVGNGIAGKCYLGICKRISSMLVNNRMVIVTLDINGKVFAINNAVDGEVLLSQKDSLDELKNYLIHVFYGFFLILLILVFVLCNTKKNVKY